MLCACSMLLACSRAQVPDLAKTSLKASGASTSYSYSQVSEGSDGGDAEASDAVAGDWEDAESGVETSLNEASGESDESHDESHAHDTADFAARVNVLKQFPDYPGGCEVISLTSVLVAMGFDVETDEIIDDYLAMDDGEGDFVNKYSGTPRGLGSGYPPVIANAGNAYLEAKESGWRFANATGSNFDELLALVDAGKPVLVWTTMSAAEPQMTGIVVDGYEWYSNEHCVVLYNHGSDYVKVMDPIDGLVERNTDDFARIYDLCGKMAVILE